MTIKYELKKCQMRWTNKTSFEWLIYFPCFGRDDGIWECAVEIDRCVENKG